MWMPLTLSYGALNLPLFLVRERIESDIRWGLKDPESGEVAQVPRVAFAENLRAQGSGLSTRQAEGSRVVRVVVGKPREAAGEAAQDRQTAGFIL